CVQRQPAGDGRRRCAPPIQDFHQAIVSACNSTTLMATLSYVFDRFLRYHMLAESFRGKPVVDDHKILFELSIRRDVAGATDVVRRHVQ
ncbi:FCD domain-containing protein, partial [Rhizobium johnstonii]|uniref:FCD domain-containing protein n=1 Tax=Rhizobium johnstonii TaxID=3019933 RepID=UPI003F95D66C